MNGVLGTVLTVWTSIFCDGDVLGIMGRALVLVDSVLGSIDI